MVKQKVVIGVFRHTKSKYGLSFELALRLHGLFLPIFLQNYNSFLPVFRKTSSFWVKLGSQSFQNIHPCIK